VLLLYGLMSFGRGTPSLGLGLGYLSIDNKCGISLERLQGMSRPIFKLNKERNICQT